MLKKNYDLGSGYPSDKTTVKCVKKLLSSKILPAVMGSDHAPIVLEISI